MRLVLVLAALLVAVPLNHALASLADAVRLFDEGNQLYAAGSYAAAIASYESAIDVGYGSAALYYNLGNAYFRADQVGQAIRAYERARRIEPDDSQIRHNLEIARDRTVDRLSRLPEPFWRVWWQSFSGGLGSWGLFMLGAAFYMAAVGFTLHRLIVGRRSPWLRRGLSLSALLALFFVVSAFAGSIEEEQSRHVVVLSKRVTLHQEPAADAEVSAAVHEGLVAKLQRSRGDWVLLRLPNGVRGWVLADTVGEI